jgi:hypothetical protein
LRVSSVDHRCSSRLATRRSGKCRPRWRSGDDRDGIVARRRHDQATDGIWSHHRDPPPRLIVEGGASFVVLTPNRESSCSGYASRIFTPDPRYLCYR